MYEVDEQIMARTDAEFRQYVCDSLRALKEQQDSYEAQTKQLFELTQKIAEIVETGESLFRFAGKVGGILQWIGGTAAGAVLLWQVFGEHIKGWFK